MYQFCSPIKHSKIKNLFALRLPLYQNKNKNTAYAVNNLFENTKTKKNVYTHEKLFCHPYTYTCDLLSPAKLSTLLSLLPDSIINFTHSMCSMLHIEIY